LLAISVQISWLPGRLSTRSTRTMCQVDCRSHVLVTLFPCLDEAHVARGPVVLPRECLGHLDVAMSIDTMVEVNTAYLTPSIVQLFSSFIIIASCTNYVRLLGQAEAWKGEDDEDDLVDVIRCTASVNCVYLSCQLHDLQIDQEVILHWSGFLPSSDHFGLQRNELA